MTTTMPEQLTALPQICVTGTAVCLGGGPSLTAEDVDYCRGKATVIAINDAYKLAPWADVLYACDPKWWRYYGGVPSFTGYRYSIDSPAANYGVQVLKMGLQDGFSADPIEIRHGKNSGYQALQVAVKMGARRVLLLGYDMQPTNGREHWFGSHPSTVKSKMPFESWQACFQTIVEPLQALGVQVVNCSRETALSVFPRQSLLEALP